MRTDVWGVDVRMESIHDYLVVETYDYLVS